MTKPNPLESGDGKIPGLPDANNRVALVIRYIFKVLQNRLIAADQPQAGGQACLPARADGCIRWL